MCNDKASQIDIFTNKLDNSDNTTILWAFLLIFILHQSYHQTHVADQLIYIIAMGQLKRYQFLLPVLFNSSQLFFSEKILIELLNRLPHVITQSIDWYDGFSRENCIWSPCFLFTTAWLSLDTSGETTSWTTFVCSLVSWD